jgi:hypothetical protein
MKRPASLNIRRGMRKKKKKKKKKKTMAMSYFVLSPKKIILRHGNPDDSLGCFVYYGFT